MKGLVAAGHGETAAAAAEVLADGGNAVDAALAGLCAACVAEPVLASLGGGGFLVARPGSGREAGRTRVHDFFVQTPKRRRPEHEADFRSVSADFGPARQSFHVGLGAVATPGVVAGLFAAAADLGRLPVRRLVEPAIALARRGVRVTATQAYVIQVVRAILESDTATRALFTSPERSGELLAEGETQRQPDLADALEILAIEGADLFYRGEMGRALVRDCAGGGGHLAAADLEGYSVERRAPVSLDGFGARLLFNPPPAMGGLLVAYALALWQETGPLEGGFGSRAHVARLVATLRATAEARLRADADGMPAEALVDRLLSPAGIARACAEMHAGPQAVRGTTHISVVDAEGGAASLSVSNGEGAAYVLPGTGIILNNMLGEADLNPDGVAGWATDRRMSSMMAPALLLQADGSVTALGSGGSMRIRSAMLQTIVNLLALRMPLQDAVMAPRLHLQVTHRPGEAADGAADERPERLSVEPGFEPDIVRAAFGDAEAVEFWPAANMFFGGVHAARRSAAGGFEGVGDERRGGAVRIA